MADLIDRQAAIKAIEDLQDCYNGFSDTYDKTCIIGVLEELPSAQRTGRWIPCSERLPVIENNSAKKVLVTTSWGSVYEAYYCVDHWEINDIQYKLTSIVAWMPLPEPYKEEQE